jgi:integrase
MSQRSGQVGTVVKVGGWYRVRFRIDIPGQFERKQMSIRICPTSGPALLSKTERERRKIEIVTEHGANSVEHFEQVAAIDNGTTFRAQAKKWLHHSINRKRNPIAEPTVAGYESYLKNHLNPLIGDLPLADVNNGTLKTLVTKLTDAGLGPKTIHNIVQAMEGVVASALNENGEELYPRKWNFDFADMPVIVNQHTPSLTGEEISALVAAMQGQERMLGILIATSGLRIGELSALQVNHLIENALCVEQTVWHGRVRKRKGKSQNFLREVDLHSSVATMLREFIGGRKDGFIFRTRKGTPIHQSNFLRRDLHPALKELGFEKQGFHGFRRFRVTHLESNYVPRALVQYWTGHAKSGDGEIIKSAVTDKYVKMHKDRAFRAEVAERIGIGFDLPPAKSVQVWQENCSFVPSVPRFPVEVAVGKLS